MDLNDIIITKITNVLTIHHSKGKPLHMHNRQNYGISFALSGQITYEHNGVEYVSDTNTAVILPKGQSYTLHIDKGGFFPLINFECTNYHSDSFMLIPLENIRYIKMCFDEMQKFFLSGRSNPRLMSKFYDIIDHLMNEINHEQISLLNAIRYIENNFQSNITNHDLAKECMISEEYFRKLFKKKYGISPKQYIVDIRINNAKQMLTEGIYKINAISEKCGFSNPYHFCRFFKQKVGMTPTEYMNKNRIYKI